MTRAELRAITGGQPDFPLAHRDYLDCGAPIVAQFASHAPDDRRCVSIFSHTITHAGRP